MFKHTLRVQVHCSRYLLNMVNIYLNRLSSFETSLEERRSHHSPPKSLNRLPVLLLHALLCPRCFQCHVSTFALATICSSSQKQRSPLLRHCPFQIKRTTCFNCLDVLQIWKWNNFVEINVTFEERVEVIPPQAHDSIDLHWLFLCFFESIVQLAPWEWTHKSHSWPDSWISN